MSIDLGYLIFSAVVIVTGFVSAYNSKRLITATAIVGLMLALVGFAGFYLLLVTFRGL